MYDCARVDAVRRAGVMGPRDAVWPCAMTLPDRPRGMAVALSPRSARALFEPASRIARA